MQTPDKTQRPEILSLFTEALSITVIVFMKIFFVHLELRARVNELPRRAGKKNQGEGEMN